MLLLIVALFVLQPGFTKCDVHEGRPPSCTCSYHPGGCVISTAAPAGFKCECSYIGAWRCSGAAYPCLGKELCPGNQADYCACLLGEGDCGGYVNPVKDCANSGKAKIGVTGTATCNCQYRRGGCVIHESAPYGWKCICNYRFFWKCFGWPQQCAINELCPGEDYSYCGCQQGGGDCGGYRDMPACELTNISTTCDCNRAADWNKGFYTIEEVTYNTTNFKIVPKELITLAEKDIPNPTSSTQSITLTVGERLQSSYSFSRTSGISIYTGAQFAAGIPFIAENRITLSITGSSSHTFGETETMERSFDSTFVCNGYPQKHTKCTVTMEKGLVTVPYTMKVRHSLIPNCICDSYGVWSGTQAYNSKLSSVEIANCYNKDCTV